MNKIFTLFIFFTLLNIQNLYSQCTVNVDILNISHITCPNGGAVGGASVIQASFINYSWQNITNGQYYNGGGGNGGTFRNDLDAGFYVITASSPYSPSCPSTIYSDTFEILEAEPAFQFNPTQACPSLCNVLLTASMQVDIPSVSYTYQFDANPIVSLPNSLTNQCGGLHTYEIFADGISCGIENIGISQFAQMNLATSVINATCTQQGSSTVSITGVGASAISTYCASTPTYNTYTTIDNIVLVGDNTTISNNTSSICDTYQDYTSQSADVTPGNLYNLNIDLGTCNFNGPGGSPLYLKDIANVYVDWNIDGDFNDLNEWVGQVNPTQSPSTHTISITVPVGAIPGQSRMRIVAQNNQYQPTNQAMSCDVNTAWFGSTEDYTLVVSGSVATPVTYLWSDGQTTQTATNLPSGTYTITITDANGCSASDTAVVGGQSNVSVTASGTQTICNGGVPLPLSSTSPNNGVNYSWSPSSDFVNSNLQNPVFANGLANTTTYTITFTDVNGCIAIDQVTITVNPIPTATLSVIPNPACVGENILLTAITSIPVNKFRFQYKNGGGWINMTSPPMGNNNPITYYNITNTTQFRVRVKEGTGCDTGPWSPIILVPISVIATQPINHN